MTGRARFALLRTIAAGIGGIVLLWLASLGAVLAAGALPELRDADAILVLGAAQYNGRPSPVFRARLDHALTLYRQDLAAKIVLTGGVGAGDTISEAEVGRRYLAEHGVPAEAMLTERRGLTSAQSIEAAAVLMRAHGLRSALVVSDPFHVLRAELLARKQGLIPYRAPAPDSPIMRAPGTRWRFVLRESVLFPATALVNQK